MHWSIWLLLVWIVLWCVYRTFIKNKPVLFWGIWKWYWEPGIRGITLNEGGLPANLTTLFVPIYGGYRITFTMYFFGLRIHWSLEIEN